MSGLYTHLTMGCFDDSPISGQLFQVGKTIGLRKSKIFHISLYCGNICWLSVYLYGDPVQQRALLIKRSPCCCKWSERHKSVRNSGVPCAESLIEDWSPQSFTYPPGRYGDKAFHATHITHYKTLELSFTTICSWLSGSAGRLRTAGIIPAISPSSI